MGKDFKYYEGLQYPLYKRRNMDKPFMAADCMRAWAQSEYEMKPAEEKTLLSQMVYYGKQLYFIDAMLPDVPDSIKIGYTAENMKWTIDNEANLWGYFIDKSLLFETNQDKFFKYINEGPTTNGLPKEAPAELGRWVGWQIVRAYMEKNDNVTLEQLMNETNAQSILEKSKYKPTK
jgi:hypothetical protein